MLSAVVKGVENMRGRREWADNNEIRILGQKDMRKCTGFRRMKVRLGA